MACLEQHRDKRVKHQPGQGGSRGDQANLKPLDRIDRPDQVWQPRLQ